MKRTLYCDRDLSVFLGSRPVIINGITDIITRDDLLDRSILIRQSKPKSRKSDSALAREFTSVYPRVFGALIYCMVSALARAEDTTVNPSIRMIEAAQWAASAEQDAGFEPGSVSACYMATREHATDVAAEDSFMTALLELVPAGSTLTDTPTGFLKRLFDGWEASNPKKKPPEKWPSEPRGFRSTLDRKKSALESLGVAITYARTRTETSSSARTITLTRDSAPAKAGLYLAVDNTRTPMESAEYLLENV